MLRPGVSALRPVLHGNALRMPAASQLVKRSLATPSSEPFHALMVGAGYAMFGTPEGPWNLSRRLETRLGPRLVVNGVVEVDPPRAEAALALKREGYTAESYADATIYPTVEAYADQVRAGAKAEPKAIMVATPPIFRGGLSPSKDLEMRLTQLFPNAHIFLEKPVATGTPWQQSVEEAKSIGKTLEAHNGVVSVGYVLRYLKAVKQMKDIIEENNLTVMATTARLVTAYEMAIKTEWWNKDILQGPIIEQGTHIVDLCRYFGGEVDMDTIAAHALEAHEKPGFLSKRNFDETVIPDDMRIPRATSASWKYANGAVGNMLHAIALHGRDYSIELVVYADGYQLILADPFGTPALHVRKPGSDVSEIHPTPGDDPYQTEMNHFIDAIEGGPEPSIHSSYEDAARTYEMTWHIRNSSEFTTTQQLKKYGRAS